MWLPLNRYYKPLGMPMDEHVDYKDFSFMYIPGSEINFDVLWDNGDALVDGCFYTYSDYNAPIDRKDNARYISIIKLSFFDEKNIDQKIFLDFWKRQYHPAYNEELQRNLKRFST